MRHLGAKMSVGLAVRPGFATQMVLLMTAVTATAAPSDQTAATTRIGFEVASVKPSVYRPRVTGAPGERGAGGGCPTSLKMDRGRVDIQCATLTMLIGYAFRHSPDRIKGADWMMALGTPRFDISATLPQGASTKLVPEMLQLLLADRFQLAIHSGTTNGEIFALVVAKGGLKAKRALPEPSAPSLARTADPDAPASPIGFFGGVQTHTVPNADGGGSTTTISNPRMGIVRETDGPDRLQRWEAASISLEGLADLLDMLVPLSSPIVDRTGLQGRYQMLLEVTLNERAAAPRMDMESPVLSAYNDGLRKLGLQLERRKGAVATMIVDHVEKTPSGN